MVFRKRHVATRGVQRVGRAQFKQKPIGVRVKKTKLVAQRGKTRNAIHIVLAGLKQT